MHHPQPFSAIERRSGHLAPLSGFAAGLLALVFFAGCERGSGPQEQAGPQKPTAEEHADHQGASKQASAVHEHQAPVGHDHAAEHDHGAHGKAPPVPSGLNPVQHEMRLLQDALLDAVRAIANGDVRGVAESLHEVHGAKEHTEGALRAGTYTPPKNGKNVARFIELDEEFHDRLVPLVTKSKANDVAGTAAALGKVLESCHGCHTEFRF